MHPDQVKHHVGTLPYMQMKQALVFWDLIREHQLQAILELGFFHGVSTAYLAGAAEQTGGRVTTIDLETARSREPNIEEVLGRAGLRDRVEIFYEPRTFNWRMMRFLEQEPPRRFDLVYIDGAHTWVDSGFAFCLASRLLRPGGWVVFDDIRHTFRTSSSAQQPWVQRMTEEEQVTPQVERVFSLLTMRDPTFDTFRYTHPYAFARKRTEAPRDPAAALAVEQAVYAAALQAHTDPQFRQRLLEQPAAILSGLTGAPAEQFRHVRFTESGLRCPSEPEEGENGLLTHSLELAEWQRVTPRDSRRPQGSWAGKAAPAEAEMAVHDTR